MIDQTEVFLIGHFYKVHGVSGELGLSFETDIFDRIPAPYWVIEIEGILVPFFIDSYRFIGNASALIRLEGVDTADRAKSFVGRPVFFPRAYAEPDDAVETSWSQLIGFEVWDLNRGCIGEITAVDESTMNILLIVEQEGIEHLLPAQADFIQEVDAENHQIRVHLPEGFLDLQA